ncbi:TRAP transporter small permease subunit [Hydrogenophaga sp.]|uniref:TRAP transporter small permease subunit n=1 Tax=Hydrogenophaga sp. TaxID=1904254 RepID=UPI0025C50D1E|nr:TRAP transporter small permease subunit [Hydrogenophaga sp.]
MLAFIRTIDYLSETIGRTFGWTVLVLTAGTCYEVFKRYVLNDPTDWAYDMSYMLYGALFLMSGAYALAQGAHVRGDFIYRRWTPRTQAKVDLVLYILFYFPGVLALVFAGFFYGLDAARIQEVSVNSPVGVPVWPLKMIIFVAGVTLLLQGLAEVCRCLLCIRDGRWPPRGKDVVEMDVALREQHGQHSDGGAA